MPKRKFNCFALFCRDWRCVLGCRKEIQLLFKLWHCVHECQKRVPLFYSLCKNTKILFQCFNVAILIFLKLQKFLSQFHFFVIIYNFLKGIIHCKKHRNTQNFKYIRLLKKVYYYYYYCILQQQKFL